MKQMMPDSHRGARHHFVLQTLPPCLDRDLMELFKEFPVFKRGLSDAPFRRLVPGGVLHGPARRAPAGTSVSFTVSHHGSGFDVSTSSAEIGRISRTAASYAYNIGKEGRPAVGDGPSAYCFTTIPRLFRMTLSLSWPSSALIRSLEIISNDQNLAGVMALPVLVSSNPSQSPTR